MIYIYRTKASNSARDLAEAMTVNARKLSDLRQAHYGQGIRAGDAVVCWGEQLIGIEGVRVLNGTPIVNKLTDAQKLKAAGVATVEVSATRPTARMVDHVTPLWEEFSRAGRYYGDIGTTPRPTPEQIDTFCVLAGQLKQAIQAPAALVEVWLPRRFNHIGGADLLNPPAQPDYYSKREELVEEFRVHCFGGKSIRAGQKIAVTDGAVVHPWIRSLDGGWRIRYDEFHSKKSMRELAAKAVAALGLDFGAVDIGKKADGTAIVLEVNRAPGVEGGTLTAYAEAIRKWVLNEAE